MRNLLAAASSVALLFGVAIAQQTPSPEPQAPPPDEQSNRPTQRGQPAAQSSAAGANHLKIAPGSVIPVQLSKTVDAKKAKTGDEVVATVTQDMKTNSGDVLVPKDTKVIGHVTEAQPRNKEQRQSELGIAFDRAVIKGDQTQLPMSIQAVIAPPSSSNNSNAGGPEQPPSSPAGNSPSAPMAGSRPGGMGGGSSTAPQQNYPASGGGDVSEPQTSARPAITGDTQGVIGMSDLKLESSSQNSQQGSVLTSEKNNVKIEKGTLLLLRVSQ
ncbi:MAG TPA: hypothetical protein VMS18_10385 [Candidatus Binatia bacterium]|nr:hypothetical protein [Candidatus Binatia bacterium]